jgi:4-hydroxy-tetrahydrodipicolinate synthase
MSAIVTPFDAKGGIDEANFRRQLERQIVDGVSGFVVCGCTGEFWSLTGEERRRLFDIAVSTVAGRVTVIAGTSAIRTSETIALTDYAKSAGCDGAMIMPPWFVRMNAADIFAHFRAISDAVRLPIMAYNIPSTNINPLTPDIADSLADIDTVVAIKESSFDFRNFARTASKVRDRLRVFGPIGQFGPTAILMGAVGSVGVSHHFWGSNPTRQYEALVRGDVPEILRLQRISESLFELMTANGRNMYATIKGMMLLTGNPAGPPREPLRPLGADDLALLGAALEQLGIKRASAIAAE